MAAPIGGAGLLGAVEPISAGIGLVTNIVGTISQISDSKKRREFDQALGRLDLAQRIALEKQVSGAKTLTERLAILTNAVSAIRQAEVTQKLKNKGMAEADERKKERLMIYLIVGGGIAALLAVFLIKKA